MFLGRKTNVVLPQWITCQRGSLSDDDFNTIVCKYLQRYKNYHLREVIGNFAVCDCYDESPRKLRRKKA